jgi:hypothetical protein
LLSAGRYNGFYFLGFCADAVGLMSIKEGNLMLINPFKKVVFQGSFHMKSARLIKL